MYEKVFQLASRPFVSTPDVERFYSARAIHQALSKACSSIDRASGTVLVIGPTGSGKTLFLNMIEDQFQTVYRVVNIACARLEKRQDLLQNILFELNQPYLDMSEGELRLALIDYLKPDVECPNGILLLVDEAHLLKPALLDEIRLLTNLVRNGRPRAQLVLAGNMKLEENLMDANLDSFNQRVAARCYLANFNRSETEGYIVAAVARAGGSENQIFTDDGMEAVHEVTEGCPRLINQVCDHAMILAASAAQNTIDAACIHEAWADVQHLPNSWAEVASQAASEQAELPSSPIEFGSLDDEPYEDANIVPPTESNAPETQQDCPAEVSISVDSDWNEIEFGELDDDESEQLKSLSSYEATPSTGPEVTYEFEQVIETKRPATTQETSPIEEYQLAPAEPLLEERSSLSSFPIVSEEVVAHDAGASQPNDYVDVRFKDLAQFLASGGNVEPMQSKENEEDNLALQDQLAIQDELTQSQAATQAPATVEPEAEEAAFDEAYLDAQLNALMRDDTTEIKVFQGDDEKNSETDLSQQPWQDLFAEPFEQEELVYDPYTALVVKQNTSSLSISRDQLAILEEEFQLEPQDNDFEAIEPAAESNTETAETIETGEIQLEVLEQEPEDEAAELELEDKSTPANNEHEAEPPIDEQELLDTIQKQQEEIADQIFQLKQDLSGTGVVDVDDRKSTPRFFGQKSASQEPEEEPVEIAAKFETHLESVNDDDRDIIVITRTKAENHSASTDQDNVTDDETPVSKGRAIRMDYSQLFKQLRAAE